MQIDQTTLQDLSIFETEEEQSVFHHLNFTHTNDGKHYLKQILSTPLKDIDEISDIQQTIQYLISVQSKLTATITNGTIMVIERFYETIVDTYPASGNKAGCLLYKFISKSDYSLTQYSVHHFIYFLKGMQEVADLLENSNSKLLQLWRDKILLITHKATVVSIINETATAKQLSPSTLIHYAAFLKHRFKSDCNELIEIFGRLDAYLSLAFATKKYHFTFPEFVSSNTSELNATGLYHLLLFTPVAYDINLNKNQNFLFLTGANMAGKSTFIKAIGIAVYLAHIGMAVPAQTLQLSYFDGLLSNIHIVDNIFKNESYFFNEVQRIKSTVEKINDKKNWLILIDELFKGTNIQDAMKCSITVIEGLQSRSNALFVLSTHLYEIGENLRHNSNIQFKYFETNIINNELQFSYQLKDGISNDRLGYLILEKEGVVKMLSQHNLQQVSST